jgi:hypothetical protein
MVNAQQAVDLLNDALKTDPAAMTLLFSVRRSCNKSLADHPHITVNGPQNHLVEGPFTVAFIGILNGMFNSVGSEDLVAIVYDDSDNQNIIGFKVVKTSDVMGS